MTGTEFIPYKPPDPFLRSTLLAYHALTVPQISVTVSPDPLGPVNKIVRLVRRHGDRDHTIKAVLTHIPQGAQVAVECTAGRPSLTLWTDGRLDSGGFIRCTSVDYNPDTDQTIVTAEHGQPAAPDGMRLRYEGESGDA